MPTAQKRTAAATGLRSALDGPLKRSVRGGGVRSVSRASGPFGAFPSGVMMTSSSGSGIHGAKCSLICSSLVTGAGLYSCSGSCRLRVFAGGRDGAGGRFVFKAITQGLAVDIFGLRLLDPFKQLRTLAQLLDRLCLAGFKAIDRLDQIDPFL